jgi:hypothetical protein
MSEYLILMPTLPPAQLFHGRFSPADLHKLRAVRGGRPFHLEHYLAYLAAADTLALARKPDYVDQALLQYSLLCRKLAEAERQHPAAQRPPR